MRNAKPAAAAFAFIALFSFVAFAPIVHAQGAMNDVDSLFGGEDSSDQGLLDASPTPSGGSKSQGNDFLQNVQGGAGATAGNAGFGGSKSLPEFVGAIINGVLGLAGIVLTVLVIYGGTLWMTAQGSEEKIKKAKGIITSAVIGLAIVFGGYAIVTAVTRALLVIETTP